MSQLAARCEKGRAKLPLSRKHREIWLGRSLALPKTVFFNGQIAWLAILLVPVAAADPSVHTAETQSSSTKLTPELRAIRYLSREVAAWKPKNKCYSCHNNGDAARALYMARRLSYRLERNPLAETTDWLKRPDQWQNNRGKGPYSDKKLADLQFAYALSEAVKSGDVKDKKPLLLAAEKVASYQEQDGSWKLDADQIVGSPATYGRTLGTVIARQILLRADSKRFQQQSQRAEHWLINKKPKTVLDAAAVLLSLESLNQQETTEQRSRCFEVIRKGENPDGGWGPFINSQAEPFDTALVLLALAKHPKKKETTALIERGRRYLVNSQFEDGSWPETTRPANANSYPQRISTTGWVTMALLATRPTPSRR
jgi:hypothetical protein